MDAGLQPESEAGGARRPGYWRDMPQHNLVDGGLAAPGWASGRAGRRVAGLRGAAHGQLGKLGLREIYEQGRREGAVRGGACFAISPVLLPLRVCVVRGQ